MINLVNLTIVKACLPSRDIMGYWGVKGAKETHVLLLFGLVPHLRKINTGKPVEKKER